MKQLGNISIEKIWEDDLCFEIKISVESQYVSAWQTCYYNSVSLSEFSSFLTRYCEGASDSDYYESGAKRGNYAPSFSMRLKDDNAGHVSIETDLEINDVEDRTHRCVCNVYTEIGLLERFAKRIPELVQAEIGFSVSVLDE